MIYVLLLILFLPSFSFCQTVYLYRIGEGDQGLWNTLFSCMRKEKIDFRVYRFRPSLHEHLRCANDVNTQGKGLFLALELSHNPESKIFVGIFSPRKGSGRFLKIDEVPSLHYQSSICVAEKVAKRYGTRVAKLPLFPLLGIDMPGIFISAKCSKEKIADLAHVIIDAKRECE